MKKYILVLSLILLSCGVLLAQEQKGVATVIGAASSNNENLNRTLTTTVNGVNRTITIQKVSVSVGLPYMGVINAPHSATPTQYYKHDLGFPWGIRYRYNTFSEDAFTVSKGYFSDRIELNWDIKQNRDRIISLSIYRTEDIDSQNPSWGSVLKTLPADAGTFVDNNVEGGKLYRYKVAAKGVEADGVEILYTTYITGIGYRNPTGVITGNVSFTGGNPVKDVMVVANPTGKSTFFGSSLKVPLGGYINVPRLSANLKDSVTLQAWVKPDNTFNNDILNLYKLESNANETLDFKFKMAQSGSNNILTGWVGAYYITIANYIPSGEIDNKGDDVFIPITNINTSFTHFSAVIRDNKVPEIYINGRHISQTYVTKMNGIFAKNTLSGTPPSATFTSNNLSIKFNTSASNHSQVWSHFKMGGGKTAYLDEFRVWETALTPTQIQRDFRRYLSGGENGLNTYITANEKIGDYAYDLAHNGFNYHGNDAKLSNPLLSTANTPTFDNSGNNIPTNTQLGILGVTDEFGNYVISAIPYKGNGDSFTIIPSLGKHEFNPKQQLAYIGVGSTVINKVDFIDKSSFVFKGIAVYDSRDVFPHTSDAPITGDIKENEAYNAYVKGNVKYQKGEYWAVKDASGKITQLNRYAQIPVPEANVFIDNVQAIDAFNIPIQTDINGRFTIEVPIGQHAISISKSGHTFDFEGRYPARNISVVNGITTTTNTYQDFFEDRDEPITFIDNTKVTVVGRVVGGTVQADKEIGFGADGKKTYAYKDANGVSRTTVYTSENNIGTANLTLGYLPTGATSVTPEYKTSFKTNAETGEYRVALLPLNYILSKNDLTFTSGKNPDNIPILDADRTINFTAINGLKYPTFVQGKDTITGKPYQEVLKFTHVAAPIHQVLSQTSDQTMVSNGITYTIAPTQNTPIYTQFLNYSIEVQGQEIYKNYDKSLTNPVVSTVPVEGGELVPTNNLALAESEKIEVSTKDPSILIYSFQGGTPNTDIGTGFKRTINLKFRTNGIDYPVLNYKTDGILLGGVSDGSQTFVTAGPEIPDIILRDPPGSGSSATIEKGSSFSFTKETTTTGTSGTDFSSTISAGTTLTLSGGLVPLPEITTEATADATAGMTSTSSTTDGKSVSTTYSFSQTISTSDDPDWIGSDADIYIGTSANQFYGTYNDLVVTTERNTVPIAVTYMNGAVKTAANIYPKVNKAMYFSDSPEKTTFVYTQRNILTELIPSYLDIIAQINAGTLKENQNGVLTKSAYNSSINLWRKIILNNELQKYQAFKDKDQLKASLNSIIESLKDPVTKKLSPSDKALQDLLNKTFFENISFDAGIGEITKGLGIGRLSSTSYAYEVQVDEAFIVASGLTVNDSGFAMESTTSTGSGSGSADTDDDEETTTITYTLKDNDANNLLSVDVINAFDGNGPIFITKGGQTSCPYEGPELSHFYNPTHPNVTNPSATIVDLPTASQVQLSLPTIAIEKPEITVTAADVAGIFDGRNAEFVLHLRNTSTVNKDASFMLLVDQASNPDNAAINIEPNGTIVNIPAGKTVSYTMTLKKVKQDQFDYKNIKVSLASICDENAVDTVLVSATFVPACSPVSILAPSNNWLLNRNTAFTGVATKPVNIKLGDFNTSFASFQKISLEYRLKGTPNWIGLRTFYKTQQDYTIALTGGDTNIELIVGAELNYNWDIAAIGLANGTYELRARTSCNNQTAFESAIIEGKVDLTSPVLFGTPTPKNGILGLGDDITLRFNEAVKTNGTVSKFEFLVQKNQSPVKHEVSLAFDGASNTATINKPAITTGSFSIEFWLKNTTTSATAVLLNQNNGIKIELNGTALKYTIGGQSIQTTITKDNTFNHYALSYDATANILRIIENDKEVQVSSLSTKLNFTNENPIIIGGNTFKGNIHDLRFWKRAITREASVASMNSVLNGNETDLLGYWPINEGNGLLANDLARYKHLVIANTNWDITPKGTAYNFDGTNYLTFADAAKVIISKEMDATLSFWMKTKQSATATLLSNGKGDDSEALESNGFRNKWAINLNAAGNVELKAEGKSFPFGTVKVNNNSWHHVALSLTRNGSIRMYVDGNQVGSYASIDLGGFSSSSIFVGARGKVNPLTIDQNYVGLIDELSLWETARDAEQIKADQFHELDFNTTGLLLYSTFNKPELSNGNGPTYYYPLNSFEKTSSYALLNNKPLAFSEETPAIKPLRPTESIVVNAVINGDQIALNPEITDWSSVEGKVAYITVSNLNDMADNRQLSPITWSALINKNPVKWFVEGHSDVVSMIKRANENLTFDITIINKGGTNQDYTIELPAWLTLSANSGNIAPNTKMTLKATVDSDLAIGNYNTILSLITNYGYNEKIQLDLRVLEKEPNFDLDPSKFSQSMNIIGRVKLGDIFTDDLYDKVVATVNGDIRGVTSVIYDASLKEHFVYLTIYSNQVSGENVSFYIWDASDGKLKEAVLNDQFTIPYLADEIIGNYTNPAIFKNTEVTGQQISLNQGWTWTSFNVTDARFNNLNELTKPLSLGTSDLIMSNAPALFDAYQVSATNPAESGWAGTVSSNGGISNNKMYKIKLGIAQKLNIKGVPIDLNTWFINLSTNWNWFPFVVSKNIPLADALANLNASDGDVIKSQAAFAIYSTTVGWKGTLTYLKAGEGYMLNTGIAQKFTYPEYLNRQNTQTNPSPVIKVNGVSVTSVVDVKEENTQLSANYAKFSHTMSAVVKLPEGFQDLTFYNENGELRGQIQTQNVQGVDLAFITLYGDKPEKLTAYIGSGSNLQATSKSISFSADAVLGSIANPVVITLGTEKLSVFPNPFLHNFEIMVNSDKTGEAKIIISNMFSQTVFENTVKTNLGVNVWKIQPNIPAGSYILSVKMDDKVIYQKIIKN
ncbi:LamG-like jellyroll fold domain-containing protein [Pedobacter cryophilus]|uniref:T9SS type A sorting domain-containing protein n=1 Tax=Pedobacter cryophilus TaxID=2571271 RepID=A0A4U1C0Z2_9SPHI|nr:LamG-like jellyroll fold domain-containing protein [Pedobacter cryophilus]TKB98881.1 T9SS type A sorting domain-containing protein [Pedobacter cryophilus]